VGQQNDILLAALVSLLGLEMAGASGTVLGTEICVRMIAERGFTVLRASFAAE
jgi:hypothetical protein